MNNKQLIMAFITSAAVLFSATSMAQDNEMFTEEMVIPLSDPSRTGTLEVHQIYGGIKVTGYDGNEVVVLAKQEKMQTVSQMKNGLRKIQNNSMALMVEESNNHVEINAQNHNGGSKNSMNLEVKVPRNFNLKLWSINDGSTWVDNINGEIEISNINNDITLNQVSGSAVVDSVNGEIKASFKQITVGSQLAFTSFNGNVDISLPNDVQADFKLKTTSGEILTGFDIDFKTSQPVIQKDSTQKSYKVKLEKWVTGSANGGGTEITLKSHSGDLILRAQD
ncbi:DUF4097 family beta strand repeat-containing protein [Marinicella litoralis]|nr:DUF4097 family beta strand repeat-containing protein [Marinicella litoralis]